MRNGIFLIFILLKANELLVYAHRCKCRGLSTALNTTDKYPYIIALLSDDYRTGTGTLLTREWVLTCAHCVDDITHIQYGNMSIYPEASAMKNRVLKKIKYPEYQTGALSNEIGLCKVTSVPVNSFGKLSNIDYKSLVGHTVRFAGYGNTQYSDDNGGQRPLQVSKAVVASCKNIELQGPYLCLALNVDIKYQDLTEGYTGGPVFDFEKIVGIISYGVIDMPPGRVIAILPYTKWIYDVVAGRIK